VRHIAIADHSDDLGREVFRVPEILFPPKYPPVTHIDLSSGVKSRCFIMSNSKIHEEWCLLGCYAVWLL
jgi:hypothetical protein